MAEIQNRQANKSYEKYLSLFQSVTGTQEDNNIYKQFSPNFFDLNLINGCHRGNAADDSHVPTDDYYEEENDNNDFFETEQSDDSVFINEDRTESVGI